jgi:hypothetical protein
MKACLAVAGVALVESQYVVSYPPAACEWLTRLAPHVTAFTVMAVIWPWFVVIARRSWTAVSSAVSRGVKRVLTYFVIKADEIREERKQGVPGTNVGGQELNNAPGENDAGRVADMGPGT